MDVGGWWGELEGWRRTVAVWSAVAVATVLAGAVIGTALVSGTRPSKAGIVARLGSLPPNSLLLAPKAKPDPLDEPLGIGSLKAGIAVTALSEEDSAPTSRGLRKAPVGSTLLVFRVGDWTCEDAPCDAWTTLDPRVVVDGDAEPLPAGGDTFVVVLPPGTGEVDLEVSADGYTQSVSLLDDEVGPDNIALLADRDLPGKKQIGTTFRIAERTSIPLDPGTGVPTTDFVREVTVAYSHLRFFLDGQTPSSPGKAFLVLNTYYSYVGRQGTYVLAPGEAVLVDKRGNRYAGRDLDPSPDTGLLGFEVPAGLRAATFVVGGVQVEKTSSNQTTYTASLGERRIPVEVR